MTKAMREARAILGELAATAAYTKLGRRARDVLPKLPLPRKANRNKLPKLLQSSKPARKIAHREATRVLRETVMKRAAFGGGCERCGGPGVLELHHLEGGSGRRREKQWAGNCMGICAFCHREYHRDPETFREAVMEWCVRWQYPVPDRFRRSA